MGAWNDLGKFLDNLFLSTWNQHSMDGVSRSWTFVDNGVSCRAQTPKYHSVLLRINKGLAGVITVWILIYF